ncbi:MAG: hypothetical protein LBS10_10365 [Gracilibacteraceae bacterium]|jgi:hypothetical protein|nr:hypothetical protein [Gracilibacteraceae bacterium]
MSEPDSKESLSIEEIGHLFNLSSVAVENLRARFEDFPAPLQETAAGPLFDLPPIQAWGEKHGRLPIAQHSPRIGYNHKSVAIAGLPRTGKSFISSLFARDEECFALRRAFSEPGDDFTQCAVKIIVSENIPEACAQFNTDQEEYRRYSPLKKEPLEEFMVEVNAYLKEKRTSGQEISPVEYIEIFVHPGPLSAEIMRENRLAWLLVTDTPGVSESYALTPIAEADLVMLVLADSGGDAARKGFKQIVTGIAPLVATGDACFLYNLKKLCDNETEYEAMQRDAEKAMQSFEAEFAPLRQSLVDTSLNVLRPSKSVLGVPGMKDNGIINYAEDTFRRRLKEVITRSFRGEGADLAAKELREAVGAESAQVTNLISFMKEVLAKMPRLEQNTAWPDYFAAFKAAGHARVKTQDRNRIAETVAWTRTDSLRNLYDYFRLYTAENTPDPVNQAGIKLFYRLMSQEMRNDDGLGIGGHHCEDYPPVTMRAIEYICAAELRAALREAQCQNGDIEYAYRRTLIDNGIVSRTWRCVHLDANKLYLLDILTDCGVLSLHSAGLTKLVRHRYIGGLRKIGEYKAWEQCLALFTGDIHAQYSLRELIRETGI